MKAFLYQRIFQDKSIPRLIETLRRGMQLVYQFRS